jgi:hypothetical protein
MLDPDPRDYDSRDDERHANTPTHGSRGSGDRDGDGDSSQHGPRTRARDDDDDNDDARMLGRDPGNER